MDNTKETNTDNTKNALAELAERLMHHLEIANAVAGFDQQVWSDIRKSQRIIAELANVDGQPPDYIIGLAYMAYTKCRAIAEE